MEADSAVVAVPYVVKTVGIVTVGVTAVIVREPVLEALA
jgi:hypothetical protein